MITSADFQNNPSILMRAPILSGKGWSFEAADSTYTLGKADVIDLNQNGVDTYGSGGFLVGSFGYYDPALTVSLKELRQLALAHGTEVLTSDDLRPGQVQVEDLSVGMRFNTREIHANRRSLEQLARHEVPGARSAWAVDTVKGEFLVYERASSSAPAPAPAPEPTTAPPSPVSAPLPAPSSSAASAPAAPAAPVAPAASPTPAAAPSGEESRRSGGGLLAGCALAMASTVLASAVPGPAGLGVLAGGFLAGALVAVKFS